MIQKSQLQKSLNNGLCSDADSDKQNSPKGQNLNILSPIHNFGHPGQEEEDETDYKALYEQELIASDELVQKIAALKQKITLLQNQNYQLKQLVQQSKVQKPNSSSRCILTLPKKSQKQILFEEIRSYKSILPNSMKVIQFDELENFPEPDQIDDQKIISQNMCPSLKYVEVSKKKITFEDQKSQKSIMGSGMSLKVINDESLIDCLAAYGLSDELKIDEDDEDYQYYEGQLTFCSKAPHQIVKHSSKLIYPNKISKENIQVLKNEEAIGYAVEKISQTLKSQEIKTFTLIFQPASFPQQSQHHDPNDENEEVQIIDLINKERRFYAICLPFQDFDFIQESRRSDNSLEDNWKSMTGKQLKFQQKTNKKIQNEDQGKFTIKNILSRVTSKNIPPPKPTIKNIPEENLSIKISRKVITIFTKFPFIHFFEELLVHSLKESFQYRKNQMKKNISNLKSFAHEKTIEFLKTFFQNLNTQYELNKRFSGKINEIFEIQFHSARLSRFQTLSVELSKTLIKNYYSEIWAFPVLRLFNLDNFLDVFNLVMLEEKVIFVCENESILTTAIFLFSRVLMKPFDYPYPVVSIIPNQYDYFNAPFPIIYGCLNSKQNLTKEKIPKTYKNVYVIITPAGIEIMNNKNGEKLTARKSPKLRDKLMPYFIKMQNQEKERSLTRKNSMQGLGSFGSLLSSTFNLGDIQTISDKFNFSTNNRHLAHQIIDKVCNFLTQVKEQIPSRQKVEEIKKKIEKEIKLKNAPENQTVDIDKETYERVKARMLRKTTDSFVQRFLDTQIVGLEILR